MIKKIDTQLETYDEKVGSSLNTIQCNSQGQISLADLKNAFQVIKHKPSDETIEAVVKKLDVDQDGFVVSSARVCKCCDITLIAGHCSMFRSSTMWWNSRKTWDLV
jgi:LETM1 and EF-hand domain-containing protein 1